MHQAIAAEREFLEALLSIDTGERMPGAVRAPAHVEDEWLGELMDAAVVGLCARCDVECCKQSVGRKAA